MIKTLLVAGDTRAKKQVFVNRIRDITPEKLPAISVRTVRETATRLNETPVSYERSLTIGVVCIAAADDQVDDLLDEMAEEVSELIIGAEVHNTFEWANRLTYESTDWSLEIASEEIGACMVNFIVEYDTRHDPNLDDLEGVNIKMGVAGTDKEDDYAFSDEVTLPT